MITLHPDFLKSNGKKAFAVLRYEEFLRVEEELDDFEDLKALRAAKVREAQAPTVSLGTAKRKLGIGSTRRP